MFTAVSYGMDSAFFFIISFLAAFIAFRGIIHRISRPLGEITAYTREGAKFHHLHFGIIFLFLGFVLLFVFGTHPVVLCLMGFSFGMVMDEFIPSLYLPEPEPLTTKLYRGSFLKTAALFAAASAIILAVLLLKLLWKT